MAILVDLNQVMISGLLSQVSPKEKLEEDLIRHIVLNTLRSNVKKFKEYGEVIICCDNKHYWRKDYFPYYKAHRTKDREKSDWDWGMIFKVLNMLRDDLKTHFPYKVIDVDGAEADDVIGSLVQEYYHQEKILILSGDKDFVQLQKYPNVKQYDPVQKKFRTTDDPARFIKEHIIRGDAGDGVPNFLSTDNCLVVGDRQKPVDRKSTRLNSSHIPLSRMPSSA